MKGNESSNNSKKPQVTILDIHRDIIKMGRMARGLTNYTSRLKRVEKIILDSQRDVDNWL